MSTNLSGENVESMEMCLHGAGKKKLHFHFLPILKQEMAARFVTGLGLWEMFIFLTRRAKWFNWFADGVRETQGDLTGCS